MARTPPQYAHLVDEPTIIIDPSLYLPPPRSAFVVAVDAAVGIARGLLVATLAGATVFSIAHVLRHHALSHELHERRAPVVLHVQPAEEALVQKVTPPAATYGVDDSLHTSTAFATALTEERLDASRTAPAAAPAPAEDSTDLMSQVRVGRRHLHARRLDEAEAAFKSVLAVRSSHPAALSGLARVSLARADVVQALELSERAVKAAPYQASYHVVLGDVLRAAGDLERSQAEYETAARLNPEVGSELATRALPENPF